MKVTPPSNPLSNHPRVTCMDRAGQGVARIEGKASKHDRSMPLNTGQDRTRDS
jgi:hypothetical protein